MTTTKTNGGYHRLRDGIDRDMSIADFNEEARWCAWREEQHGSEGKPTKIPYCHYRDRNDCRKAQSNNSRSWITRREAEACWRRMQREDRDAVGGVGLFLGDLGNGYSLMGIDLDRCLDARGEPAQWARQVMERNRFDSYAEVSPSGHGVKLFFLIADADVPEVTQLLGGKTRRAFAAGEHREMAFDTQRFYAATEDSFFKDKCIRPVGIDAVRWFIEEAGPAYQREHGVGGGDHRDDGQLRRVRDESGSGHGFRFLLDCKQQGMSYEEARVAILADDGIAGDWARGKGSDQNTERAIKLAWDKAYINFSWEEPDISLLDDRRGELPPFPLELLPIKLQDLVKRAAHGAGCSDGYVAMPLLGTAAALIGNGRRVRASKSWSVPHTLWVATCGFSGDGKTPGLAVTKNALNEVERGFDSHVVDLKRRHQQLVDQADAAAEIWKAEFKKAVKANREPPPRPQRAEPPEKFIAPRLVVTDVTVERMCELLVARPKGMLLLIDELSGLLLNMERYSGGMDNQFWLMAWDGQSYSCERKNGTSISVYLLIGIVGGTQPDRLPQCFKVNDGMYARFLWTWPAKAPYQPLSDDSVECDPDLVRIFDALALLGENEQEVIKLTTEARVAFEQLRKHVNQESETFAGREREWWSKIPTHVLRIAGTLCYLEWAAGIEDEPRNLQSKYIKAAVRLTLDYLWPHARACLRQIGLTQRNADARIVLRWLRGKDLHEVRREDVRRDALSQRLDAEQTDCVLSQLARAGWIRRMPTGSGRGRTAQRWEVNPKLSHNAI
jgi:hypothetical protein